MADIEQIKARRARDRARRRRRRVIAVVVAVIVVVAALAAGAVAIKRMGEKKPVATASATPTKKPRKTKTPSPAATVTATAVASATPTNTAKATPTPAATKTATPKPSPTAVAAAKPPITKDFIDFNATRRAEMVAYSRAHYGISDLHMKPRVIVLHYTCTSDYPSTHAIFVADTPNHGVKPGVVSQFVIDKNGGIYQQIPLGLMGRHTVGLNYTAIGIEVVQECRSTDSQSVAEILGRKKQAASLVALVRWLMRKYDIPLANVIGHGTANDSPYYKDNLGWKNDHTDWSKAQVAKFRKLVKKGS